MTTNHDRATTTIGTWIDDNLPHDESLFGADEAITEALVEDNLIAADPVALAEVERNFVIDSLAANAYRAAQLNLPDTRDAWEAAVNAFIAHTKESDTDDVSFDPAIVYRDKDGDNWEHRPNLWHDSGAWVCPEGKGEWPGTTYLTPPAEYGPYTPTTTIPK